jgi:hypothetical protein
MLWGTLIIHYRITQFCHSLVPVWDSGVLKLFNEQGSAVQNPEKLPGGSTLMGSIFVCVAVVLTLLRSDIPWMQDFFKPNTADQ